MSFTNRIQDEVTRRGIKYLVHFTQAINLPSIVQHGILPRTHLLERDDIEIFVPSGQYRLDEGNRAVSVSISAISKKIFSSKDKDCGHSKWVALWLHPSILWTHNCRFCHQNAATKVMKRDTKKRSGPWGFGQMFLDECLWAGFKGASYRTETGIPSHDTTYSDAEVQVFTPIHPELILRAWVWKIEMSLAEAVQEQLNKIPQLERQTCLGPLKVFNNRHEVWLEPDES